jgi:hypothetical protein
MNFLLERTIVAAQDFDIEGWMDILVLVVIAAVYGLGALIRSKSKKAEEQTREQQQTGKSQRKPSMGGRGLLEQFIREVKQAAEEAKTGTEVRPPGQKIPQKTAKTQAVLQKYPVKAKKGVTIQPKTAPAKPKVSKPAKVQADFEKLGEIDKSIYTLPDVTPKVAGLPGKHKEIPAEVVESIHLSEVLSDYKDPEELKRAILHYEILGRPLALRDPSRGIIGL